MEPHYYEVNLGWQYDRLGQLSGPGLNDTIEVATPSGFTKGMPGIWSPEHLLVAAVSGCFMTTFLAIAENSKLDFDDLDIRAVGKLDMIENKLMVSEIQLFPVVLITDEADVEKAKRVLMKTEKACLITNSVKSVVTVEPLVRTAVKEYD